MDNTPKAGERAPEFELPDSTSRKRSLKELTGTGNVMLVFFRGLW